MPMSDTKKETLMVNPTECNSNLMSGTKNIYPYPYIDVNDHGHHLRSESVVMNYLWAGGGNTKGSLITFLKSKSETPHFA